MPRRDNTNLVPDIRNAEVVRWEERGGDNASMFYDMGGNTILEPHISEFGVGEYKLVHRALDSRSRSVTTSEVMTLLESGVSAGTSPRLPWLPRLLRALLHDLYTSDGQRHIAAVKPDRHLVAFPDGHLERERLGFL